MQPSIPLRIIIQYVNGLEATMTIQKMLADLAGWGFSQAAIAKKAGTTQPTIHRASKGSGIAYETGKAIEAMHKEAEASKSAA